MDDYQIWLFVILPEAKGSYIGVDCFLTNATTVQKKAQNKLLVQLKLPNTTRRNLLLPKQFLIVPFNKNMNSAAYDSYDPSNNSHQCSGHSEFCFFCEFSPQPNASADVDMASELRKIVHSMAANHCEVSQIARRVHAVYESDVRSTIIYETEDNETVEAPEWTLASITRHMLHSSEFALFSKVLDHAFQNILMNLQQNIFDGDNEADPDKLDQFLKTAKAYTSYTKSMQTGPEKKKARTL